MKKFFKAILWTFGSILLIWLVLAQFFLKMRQPDDDAKKKFSQDNVELTTATIDIDGHHLHYAKTGTDTLPTLFFVHGTPGSWDAFEKYLKDKDLLKKFRMVSIDKSRLWI